jgi:hypothetical protein
MKTQVIMKRELFGVEISQKSKTEFFSATDLVRAGNQWRASNGMELFKMSEWLRRKSTKEFISELEDKYGKVKISGRGRGNHTWVHPLLFIDMALAISPKLKIEVYEWLFDHLIKYRNDSGDSYKEMCGYLFVHHPNKQTFASYIAKIAIDIQKKLGVSNWQIATEKQLEQRDRIHRDIAILADVLNKNDEAVRIALSRIDNKQKDKQCQI